MRVLHEFEFFTEADAAAQRQDPGGREASRGRSEASASVGGDAQMTYDSAFSTTNQQTLSLEVLLLFF